MKNESKKESKAGSNKQSHTSKWELITWDDLDGWAGGRSVSRGRAYQRQGRVHDLVISNDGRLLATVAGRDRYVTSASLKDDQKDNGPIQSKCTCPVGYNGCKHAVALITEYLERLGRRERIAIASPDDARWEKLQDIGADLDLSDFDDDESDEDQSDAENEVEHKQAVQSARGGSSHSKRKNWDEKIEQHIRAKSREDLADLVCSLVDRFPELKEEFRERIALGEGDVDRLIAQTREELERVTSQEAWRNNWTGEGDTPDYSKLQHRLERLVELGHADAVARLGTEIIKRGMEQLGQSHDEGETAMELGTCLDVVFKAVAKSSLTSSQKLLFAINACIQDDYGVIGDGANVVFNGNYKPADWSAVADDLAQRLGAKSSKRRYKKDEEDDDENDSDGFLRSYQRDQISGWLIKALNNAGRDEEVLTVYETEARVTGSYERLVKFLLKKQCYDDAEQWATEGIEKTAGKFSAIAENLAEQLCEVASLSSQWDIVAAHAAYHFFKRPDRNGFDKLMAAAAKADCQESVRRFAQQFLETGISPINVIAVKKGASKIRLADGWPLPIPGYLMPLMQPNDERRGSAGPHFDVLIDVAIADQRTDDVLHWYDRLCAPEKGSTRGNSWSGPGAYADRVAEAVAATHPHRALDIYRQRVNQNLAEASISAYETVASYLRRMRPIMKSLDCELNWMQLVGDIRLQHRNRPRFMEILDKLENRTILTRRKTAT